MAPMLQVSAERSINMKGIIGKKLGMTQVFDESGKQIPVTVLQAGPCFITGIKTESGDGYSAIQIGYGNRKRKNCTKALQNHFKKAGLKDIIPKYMREIRLEKDPDEKAGTEVKADIFEKGEFLDITGIVKGRGFQGVVKKYNFRGGRFSHGGGWKRKPGSVGQCEFPGRVDKGKKLPGQMGNVRRTIQNLQIVDLRPDKNLIFVKGAVPGPKGGILTLKSAKKK